MSVPALTFLAPPATTVDPGAPVHDETAAFDRPARSRRAAGPRFPGGRPAGVPRMTRGARQAATGMKVADADIQRCLDEPDDVTPDPNTPSRTRFRRGSVTVVAGADGMVLRVDRRKR
jgi:hypothetical protein